MFRSFNADPFSAGKQSTGIISVTQAHAIAPIGFESRPKCHGPARSRQQLPSYSAVIQFCLTWPEPVSNDKQLESDGEDESNILRNCADAEHGADCYWACEHEETEEGCQCENKPDSVDGRLRYAVDLLPPSTPRQSTIAGICIDYSRGGHSAASNRSVSHLVSQLAIS